jgi:hypothetical protein
MIPGFKVHDLKKNVDERGFFAEIYRRIGRICWGMITFCRRIYPTAILE